MAKRKTNTTTNTNTNTNKGSDQMEKQLEMLLAKIAELENAANAENTKPEKPKRRSRSKKRQVREEAAQDRAIATLAECIENEQKIPWKAILIDFISENEGLTTGEITRALQIAEFSELAGKDLSAPMRGSIYNLSTDRYGSTFEKKGTPAKWYIYEENSPKPTKTTKKTAKKNTKTAKKTAKKAPNKPTLEELLEMLKSHI